MNNKKFPLGVVALLFLVFVVAVLVLTGSPHLEDSQHTGPAKAIPTPAADSVAAVAPGSGAALSGLSVAGSSMIPGSPAPATPVGIAGSASGSSPGSKAPRTRGLQTGPDFTVQDAGMPRNFVLALDEIWMTDRGGKGRVVAVEAATAEELEQLVLASSAPGEPAQAILYENGVERNDFTRRVVTSDVAVRLDDMRQLEEVARRAGALSAERVDYATDRAILRTPGGLSALRSAVVLAGVGGVAEASPQLARQQAKKQSYPWPTSDTFFANQWHLRNTGQSNGTAGIDVGINVTNQTMITNGLVITNTNNTVWNNFRGSGIHIAIVDDGLETGHEDLAANVDTAIDWDFNGNDDNPNPGSGDDHGTACAGVAAAVGNNNLGVVGVAPEAKLVGLRLIAGVASDAQEAQALNWSNSIIDISSNSWGPPDNGTTLEGPGSGTAAALTNATANGRQGLGTIFTWAGGNGLGSNDNSNYDGYANSIHTIAVGAIDIRGRQAWYSEPGANLVVVAPSSGDNNSFAEVGIWTTDRTGNLGYSTSNYEHDFGGTSSATPKVSGVVALMLQAKPGLGWRDVQEILMRTARRTHAADADWRPNGAGFWFNHKYGAGLVSARAAVDLALGWANLGPQFKRTSPQTGLNVAIPDNSATGITRQFSVAPSENLRVEHVTVRVSITHSRRRNLRIELTSPSGTTSVLATEDATKTSGSNFSNWTFMTVRNWGENAAGTWTLRVADRVSGNSGTLTAATLEIFGASTAPVNPPPSVALTSPLDRTIFTPGATVTLSATATDLDADGNAGTVANVEFLANGNVVGADSAAPYSITWQPPAADYAIMARATDSEGATATTAAVNIQVRNQRPVVTAALLTPTGEVFTDQTLAVSSVWAGDADGDAITYAYQWQSSVNGAVYTDAAGLTADALPPASERSGLLWRCRIIPSDAGGEGEAFFTAAVALNRRPPSTATVRQPFAYDSDLFLRGSETSFTRKAVLSEFSQGPSGGTAEWVEFLVLKAGSLRGWQLQDAGGGTVTLADVAAWDNIPAGTLVVIYNGASKDPLLPADDLSPGAAGKIVVSSADATMCTGTWPSLSNNGDGIILRDATNAVLSQVGYGSGTTTPNIGAVSGAKSANYRGNTEDGGLLAANWSIESATAARFVKALLPGIVLSGGSYSQNFNSIPGANGTAYPDGWTSYDGSTEDTTMTVGTAASTAGANYNYGSRIGLLGSGTAFENSSLVLAIANTTNLTNLTISYKVIKVREQTRSHDFNLEYSLTSPTSGFVAVPDATYTSGSLAEGTVTSFSAIPLPAAVLNQSSVVYLRWVYKPSASAGSGSRDGLALDDVVISSGAPSPSLALAITPTSFAETAGINAATGTLSLNQAQGQDLVVSLASSDTSEVTVPASVTIPAGQTSATFALSAIDDTISDGPVTVTITATAGSLTASASVTVTDNEVALDGVTPGAPNGGDNSIWVQQLRSGALNQPALFRLGTGNPSWLSINTTTGLLSGTPDSQGVLTITLERYNSLGETAVQTFQITVGGNMSGGFSDWVSQFPGLPDPAPGADPDGDGLPNLVEYFMALSPADAVVPGEAMVLDTMKLDEVHMDYRRSKSLDGVIGGVAWRNDLTSGAWSTNNVTDVALEDHGSYEMRRATVPRLPGETRKFLRLEVWEE